MAGEEGLEEGAHGIQCVGGFLYQEEGRSVLLCTLTLSRTLVQLLANANVSQSHAGAFRHVDVVKTTC